MNESWIAAYYQPVMTKCAQKKNKIFFLFSTTFSIFALKKNNQINAN